MKAIVHCEYGGPEVLTLADVEKPTPADNQVLVKVRAASVNPLDLTIRGLWLLRPLSGLRKPKDTRVGVDYAGTVEAVGKNVTQFKPGDEVFGTEVTGVSSTHNVDLVRSIGADHVIDYTKEDFTKADQRYDLIYDLVGNHSFSERRRILNQNGICVMAGVGGAGWHDGIAMRLAGELNAYVRSRFVSQKFIAYIAQFNKQDMTLLADLMQSGKITPVIDRTYKLNQTADALRYLEQGHARGKVVINLE